MKGINYNMKKNISKILILAIILIFVIINIIYIISAKGKIECFGASMFLKYIDNTKLATINLLLFLIFIIGLTIPYLILIKKEKIDNKEIEKENKKENNDKKENEKKEIKKTFIFLIIVSILCGVILPNNSSDVYYYIATGRADSIYGYNMYDTEIKDVQETIKDDEVISASPRLGPQIYLWSSICRNMQNSRKYSNSKYTGIIICI